MKSLRGKLAVLCPETDGLLTIALPKMEVQSVL